MALTHALALFFSVIFTVLSAIFKTVFWWVLNIAYLAGFSYMALVNDWEILMFAPITFFGIISVIGLIKSATRGDLI